MRSGRGCRGPGREPYNHNRTMSKVVNSNPETLLPAGILESTKSIGEQHLESLEEAGAIANGRSVFYVKNNRDSGEWSLRAAIAQGNKSIEKGEKVEIRFEKNMTIKSSTSYQLTKGDWLINDHRSKHIVIDGENTSGPLFVIGEKKYSDYWSTPEVKFPDLVVNASHISLARNKVQGGDGVNGGGGGMAAGSAILHFNGKLTWRDSVIQGNEVEGGKGGTNDQTETTEGWRFLPGRSDDLTDYDEQYEPKDGTNGGHGGGFNNETPLLRYAIHYPEFSQKGVMNYLLPRGGSKGEHGWSDNSHHHGRHGQSGMTGLFGEGGQSGASGGGGTHKHRYDIWRGGKREYYGRGGNGGDGGDGGFGSGGGAAGWGGWRARELTSSGNTDKRYSWPDNGENGRPGKGGAWGTNAISTKQGGHGSALGTVTSFARIPWNWSPHEFPYSSLKFDNVDFIGNKAKGADGTGRFTGIFSPNIKVKYNDVNIINDQRPASGGGGTPIQNGTFNMDSEATDKSNVHDISGNFEQLEDESPSPTVIESASYEIGPLANIEGKIHHMNPEKDQIIHLEAYEDATHTYQAEINGAKNFLQAVNKLNNTALKTKTNEAIVNSSKAWFKTKSVTDGVVSDSFGVNTGAAAKYASQRILKKGIAAATKTVPGLDVFVDGITLQFTEGARIDQELAAKKKLDEQRGEINRLIPDELKIDPMQKNHGRTNDIFKDFVFGQDQVIFGANIVPRFSYSSLLGVVSVGLSKISRTQSFGTADKIGEFHLTDSQKAGVENLDNAAKYFESLLHKQRIGDEVRYVLAKDTQWKYQYTNDPAHAVVASFANDRIIVKRKVSDTTQVSVNGYAGDDRILGDKGNSYINGGPDNDFIAPELGKDEIDGGSGFDTVSYQAANETVVIKSEGNKDYQLTAAISSNNSNQSFDKITGVESFRIVGGYDIDLSTMSRPKEALMSATGHRIDPTYMVEVGSGGRIRGSRFDDTFLISYTSELNADPVNSVNKLTIVDGTRNYASGNTLFIDGLANHIEEGKREFELVTSKDDDRGDLYDVTKGSRKHILAYDNIKHERVVFEDLDSESIGLSFSTSDNLESLDRIGGEEVLPTIPESKADLLA